MHGSGVSLSLGSSRKGDVGNSRSTSIRTGLRLVSVVVAVGARENKRSHMSSRVVVQELPLGVGVGSE